MPGADQTTVTVQQPPCVVTVMVAGGLDGATVDEFAATLARVVEGTTAARIVVDVRRAHDLTSATLALLVDAARQAEARGETLCVRGVRGGQRRLFERADCVALIERPPLTTI
jgi:anti-anti-sigma factor